MRRPLLLAVALAAVVGLALWLWPSRDGERGDDRRAGDGAGGAARAGALRPHEDRTPAIVGGRVTDAATGAGIGGALVSLSEKSLDGGSSGRPGVTPEPLTARTGADGRWSLPALPSGRYAVAATARGYLPASLDTVVIRPRENREDIDLALTAGGHSLSGNVTDIGGGAIDGAIVRAVPMSTASLMDLPWASFAAVSDANGHYELTLANGLYQVEAAHPDYRSDDRSVEVRDGPRTADFTLVPGGVVYGRVLARDDDHPVPGALVTEVSQMQGFTLQGVGFNSVTTDDDGAFVLRGLRSGSLELRAVARGYTTTQPTTVDVGIGEQVTDVVVYVDRAHDITGYVRRKDDDKVAVEGVVVGAYNFSPGALLVSSRPSLADGYFEILGVPAGSYNVGGLGEDLVPNFSATQVVVADEDVNDVIVLMDAGATLTGRVEPPAAANIRVEIDTDAISFTTILPTISRALLAARSDEQGNFSLQGVTPGDIVLSATTDDGAKGTLPVEVRYDDIDGLVIKLEPRPHVAGIVVDADGNPVPDVRVQVTPKKGGGRMMSLALGDMMGIMGRPTGEDGRFVVSGLETGTHEVSVRDDRGVLGWADRRHRRTPRKPIEIEITGDSQDDLRLVVESRNGVIRGLVVDSGGGPVADAWVTAQRKNPDWKAIGERKQERRRKGDDRETKKRHSVTVSIGSEGSSVESKEEEVDADEEDGFDRGAWSSPEKPVLTDAEGRFEIRDLRDGTYSVTAESAKGGARAKLEDVALGADVVLKLETLSEITGIVTYRGDPVTNYAVSVSGPSQKRQQVMNSEGRYRVRRVEAGKYDVSVTSLKGSVRGEVEVGNNATATLDLKLVAYSSVYGVVMNQVTGKPMANMVVFATTEGPNDFGAVAMDILSGGGPRTDDQGRFRVTKLAPGKGTVVVIDGDLSGFQIVAMKEFTLPAGEDLDLGEIQGLSANTVPEQERGWLGLETYAATWERRPLTDEAPEGTDPPDGLDLEATHLWIYATPDGGPAAKAGLKRGDRIVSINGIPVVAVGAELVSRRLSSESVRVGDQVTIEVDRLGERSSYSVEAVPKPADAKSR